MIEKHGARHDKSPPMPCRHLISRAGKKRGAEKGFTQARIPLEKLSSFLRHFAGEAAPSPTSRKSDWPRNRPRLVFVAPL
jgi:hypothetical protein